MKKFKVGIKIWLFELKLSFSVFIDYCDLDGDGSISFFEFIIMNIRKELEQQGVGMSRSVVVKYVCTFMQSEHANPKVMIENCISTGSINFDHKFEIYYRIIIFNQVKVMNSDITVKIQEADPAVTADEAMSKYI